MRQKLEHFMQSKQMLAFNFAAAAGGKLVSVNGMVSEVGDDFVTIADIYGNSMIIPFVSIAFIEIKK
jgi:hypothetical protein